MNGRAKNKKVRRPAMMLAAALVILSVVSVAFATTKGFGILDFSKKWENGLVPLEGAEQEIQTNLATQSEELVRYSIAEASFAAGNYSVVVHIEPVDPERYALMDDWSEAANYDKAFIVETTETPSKDNPGQMNSVDSYSRTDDKQIIQVHTPNIVILNAENADGSTSDDQFNADGSIDSIVKGSLKDGDAPERLECALRTSYQTYPGGEQVPVEVSFSIDRSEDTLSAQLIPQGEGERWQVRSASLRLGKLDGMLEVAYTYTPAATGEEMGIWLHLLDADGNELPTSDGTTSQETLEDGTIVYHQQDRIQSLETLPEKMFLEAKVIDGDVLPGRVECRVQAGE